MDIIRDQLEKLVNQLDKIHQSYIKELQGSPPGSLINNRVHGKPAFYHAQLLPKHQYKRRRLREGDPMIEILARKEYLRRSIKNIEVNLRLLAPVLQRCASLDPADIIGSMSRAYRLLGSQSFFCCQGRDLWETVPNLEELTDDSIRFRCRLHRDWADEDYPKNTYPFPRELFLTSSGRRVRSRGEVIICDRLDHFGVPYRYDQLIYLNGGLPISPDFTFEDRNYREFYLEYCGMMDHPEYVEKHLNKRERYEENGIVPWKNICYLYSEDSGISVPWIDSIIMNFIMPRL